MALVDSHPPNPWGYAALGAAGVLPLLFGGDDGGEQKSLNALQQSTDRALQIGKSATANAEDLFGPIAQYLKDVTGGDQQALRQATFPERRRVIDQYATAKKAIGEFSPRGGGQAAAMSELQGKEAGDLAQIGFQARQQGVGQAADLSSQLRSLGLSAEQLASGNMTQILNAMQQRNANKAQGLSGLGSALGTLAGFLLF